MHPSTIDAACRPTWLVGTSYWKCASRSPVTGQPQCGAVQVGSQTAGQKPVVLDVELEWLPVMDTT